MREANHILLTTFPQHKSQNVGDNLICHSALLHIKSRCPEYSPQILFRETSLDEYSEKRIQHIVAPGFSVSNNSYSNLFSLFTEIKRLESFYPVGCSFQHIVPSMETFKSVDYNTKTLDFLKFLADRFGPLPCRDMLIVDMLNDRFGIPAVYSGDLALFDENVIGTEFTPPKEISSIVFTIGHHLKYLEQSINLLKKIRARFPDAQKFVAFHGKPNQFSQVLARRANDLGFEALYQYGDISSLEVYKDIDLHIGYRLHGHICFLRNRKPSILMIEDARSFGLANTDGTAAGCFNALDASTMEPDDHAPARAMEFLDDQIISKFHTYQSVFEFIDYTHMNFMSGYFDNFVNEIKNLN